MLFDSNIKTFFHSKKKELKNHKRKVDISAVFLKISFFFPIRMSPPLLYSQSMDQNTYVQAQLTIPVSFPSLFVNRNIDYNSL